VLAEGWDDDDECEAKEGGDAGEPEDRDCCLSTEEIAVVIVPKWVARLSICSGEVSTMASDGKRRDDARRHRRAQSKENTGVGQIGPHHSRVFGPSRVFSRRFTSTCIRRCCCDGGGERYDPNAARATRVLQLPLVVFSENALDGQDFVVDDDLFVRAMLVLG
jgi:hypothetical protein